MRVAVQTFWLPKAGNRPEEYEDAFWPPQAHRMWEGARFRCAVADGATETSFSALWAGMLVRAYCQRQPSLTRFLQSLPALGQTWRAQVTAQPLPWYAEDKVRQGAFASFLGLTLEQAAPRSGRFATWNVVAVGDSCLFHFRDDRLLAAFPLAHSEQFNSRPFLIGTEAPSEERLCAHLARQRGQCRPGDRFYLLTDALACWLLHRLETEAPCDFLAVLNTQEAFTAFVQEERLQRDAEGRPLLRNDDVTLLRLDVALQTDDGLADPARL